MGQQLRKFKMSSVTLNRLGALRHEYEHYAPIEAQPSGYVVEIESEEPSSWQDDGGPSSSRSQQQITVGLNDTNLARVNEQPLVRGPLQQLEGASRQVKNRVKAINYEIDQLNTSISGRRESVQSLSERIANIHETLRQGRGGGGSSSSSSSSSWRYSCTTRSKESSRKRRGCRIYSNSCGKKGKLSTAPCAHKAW